ncbi:MAG: GH92 family glycosyl hydrolase [Clostridia bacterium]|nr:GH92 family glycosyl hydrolase [Clostridia bacterium]
MKYIPYVNIKMGTKSQMRFSTGNALPLVQLPFGMSSFSPQTEVIDDRNGWFFQPDIPVIEGIRLTHQPSPWIGDHGTFLLMPQSDIIGDTGSEAWSGYRINESVFQPHYLKIKLLRSYCTLELTPTLRGAIIKLNYENSKDNYLSFLKVDGNYTYTLENNILYGTNDYCRQGDHTDFKMHYVAKFDSDAIDCEKSKKCENGFHIALKKQSVELEIAISYISREQAIENLTGSSFDTAKAYGEREWEEKLSRIGIDTENEEQKRTFYSCMYRAFLFPRIAYETEKSGECVHYSPYDGKKHKGVRYMGTGFWDTVRTQFPLFTLIAKKEFASMVEGFVNDYIEGGYLPRWISLGETGCMPSTLIDGVIAEAACHGIVSNEILEKALEGMIHHATTPSKEYRYGRNGIAEYIKYGYVPADLYKESVNLTEDFAYGDYCIAQVAKKLGKNDIYNEYIKRSQSYKNIFDKESGFLRGRKSNGEFESDFDPLKWGGCYTEGSAYQNGFFVPHDIEGLAKLYGSKENFLKKLDEVFTIPPKYRVHGYGGEIHEMTEMAQADLCQFAISNQPSFHLPYIYAYLGESSKCEKWIKKALELFSYKTEIGFPGDEDNGSMASWYILSTIGMYKLCPGKNEYIKIKPFVKSFNLRGEQC